MLPTHTGTPPIIPDADLEATSNHVEIVGYVGHEPEIRYSADGAVVAAISLATHRWHGSDGVLVRTTDWHRVVAHEELTEICRRLRTGELIRVTGRLRTRSWHDRHGYRQRTEIVAEHITRVHRRPSQMSLTVEREPEAPEAA